MVLGDTAGDSAAVCVGVLGRRKVVDGGASMVEVIGAALRQIDFTLFLIFEHAIVKQLP